jgi:hypothetical protein
MSDAEECALRKAFLGVYRDLAQHGLCEWDDDIIELLWSDFLADMREGFPSIHWTRKLVA